MLDLQAHSMETWLPSIGTDMKGKTIAIILAIIFCLSVDGIFLAYSYSKGKDSGYETGYNHGYEDGAEDNRIEYRI